MLTKEDAPPGQIRFLSPLGTTTTCRLLAQELSTSSSKSRGLIKLLANRTAQKMFKPPQILSCVGADQQLKEPVFIDKSVDYSVCLASALCWIRRG